MIGWKVRKQRVEIKSEVIKESLGKMSLRNKNRLFGICTFLNENYSDEMNSTKVCYYENKQYEIIFHDKKVVLFLIFSQFNNSFIYLTQFIRVVIISLSYLFT